MSKNHQQIWQYFIGIDSNDQTCFAVLHSFILNALLVFSTQIPHSLACFFQQDFRHQLMFFSTFRLSISGQLFIALFSFRFKFLSRYSHEIFNWFCMSHGYNGTPWCKWRSPCSIFCGMGGVCAMRHLQWYAYMCFQFNMRLLHSMQDVSFFDTETVGDLTSRITADCQRISRTIGYDLYLVMRNIIQIL